MESGEDADPAGADQEADHDQHNTPDLDAQRRIHTVVTIGEGIRDAHGENIKVSDYLIDVTDALHRDVPAATRMAVELSAETRATIERAKGALMITYGLDDDEAFALLRWDSQHSNIKLRDVATAITDHTSDPGIAGLSAEGKITEILAHLTNPATGDTGERAIPATLGGMNGEALSAESGATYRRTGHPG